ncbi:MAG: glutamine-hydrolyzing carbamoyl-phosphate synthase small subunit [Chitinispirillales bacterium]|jgi:carbamoyl-phosphate synthase small subunit|nr:glutamine-hydrolyzing carbamoyl-phosphate synthase small subunit [Chitinispirillales bacterium]
MKAFIILEDGKVFEGKSFGAVGEALGEVVFNTSMCGYQEILTDPSYKRQAVLMTYPMIGNYGVNLEDAESQNVFVSGFIVKEACKYPSNFMSVETLGDYLKKNGVIGIENVDTRALTKHIRLAGSMKAVLFAGDKTPDFEKLAQRAKDWEGTDKIDTVKEVSTQKEYIFEGTFNRPITVSPKYDIVAIDCGIKMNILRIFADLGCKVCVVPASFGAERILAKNPDGVFISNGPGDPSVVAYVIETIRNLIGKKPLFGICLGHQLLTLALGGKTYKLKFGHHGGNHPVKNLATDEVEITSQNHCFCADLNSLDGKVKMTHVNLNDRTCEGIYDDEKRIISVQYHPEASPGPHDSNYIFRDFLKMIDASRSQTKTL